MKNQYFGDINDYRKYGLLRSISRASDLRTMVAWMLTPDDSRTDGRLVSYLKDTEKWEKYDQVLYQKLKNLLHHNERRRVRLIEETELLSNTEYFSQHVPDSATERDTCFSALTKKTQSSTFVFLDPDNGLEVKSIPYGRKNSSKYLYWHEIASLWSSGKSLLIYQHFIRENRTKFIQRMLRTLSEATKGSFVEAFSTPYVLFLMALQPKHHGLHKPIAKSVQENWAGQIDIFRETASVSGHLR